MIESTVNLFQGLSADPPDSHLGGQESLPIAQQTLPNNLDNLPKTAFADDVFRAQSFEPGEVGNLRGVRSHDDAGGFLSFSLERLQHSLAFGIGQIFVNQHQVERVRINQLQGFPCSPHSRRVESGILKKPLKNDEDIFVAIRNQNSLSCRFYDAGPPRSRRVVTGDAAIRTIAR